MEPCAPGAKIRDGIYLTTSGISPCESPGIPEGIKTGKGAAPPKKQSFGKAGCDPGAGKDLCGLGWNVQIFWEKRDFLIYDLWDWGQRGGMGKLGMGSCCWRAELGGILGRIFFGKFLPPKKQRSPGGSMDFPHPRVRFQVGIHSMGPSPAPGEGFTPEGLGGVTWSSSDPEHPDFGSRSLICTSGEVLSSQEEKKKKWDHGMGWDGKG